MHTIASFTIFGLMAYLLGAVPFGYLVGRAKGVDIRTLGSGNIGATNVARSLGKGWGALTFCCDALKGFIPAWAFPLLSERFFCHQGGDALSVVCAVLAVVGHNWPVFLRFKGGKGIATSAGALLGVAPKCAGLGLVVWVLVFGATRYVSVASMTAAVVAGTSAWFFHAQAGPLVPVVLSALAALAVWRHKANISRLLKGTENRFRFRTFFKVGNERKETGVD